MSYRMTRIDLTEPATATRLVPIQLGRRRRARLCGRRAEALAVLESATAAGFFCYPLLASDEWLDSARHIPAFAALLHSATQEHEHALAAFASIGGDRILPID